MRQLMRSLPLAAFACLFWTGGAAPAAKPVDCRDNAVGILRASAPDGFAIYRQIADKPFLLHWIDCKDAQLGLPTAVHESVHFVTGEIDAFPLVDGGEIARPHAVSQFFAPSLIAKKFKVDDFVATYLKPGRASSSSDFLYLLDELNAYTHDLNAAVDLKKMRRDDEYIDHRDGLAALMAFVALYVERARFSEPATWSGLQKPEVAKTVAALWGAAEKVMQSSCGIPHFGTEDKTFIRQFCQANAQGALQTLIGRAPVCPNECLNAEPEDASVDETTNAAPDPSTRTLWSRRINRRASASNASAPSRGAASE